MIYRAELAFLLDIIRKDRIEARCVAPDTPMTEIADTDIARLLGRDDNSETLDECLGGILPSTYYTVIELFGVEYTYIPLPTRNRESVLAIGPYVRTPFTPQSVVEFADKHRIEPRHARVLQTYLLSIPVVKQESGLFRVLEAFLERIYGVGSYTSVTRKREEGAPIAPERLSNDIEEVGALAHMKLMEERYNRENEMMRIVSEGQISRLDTILTDFSVEYFERRVADQLRNVKNYCIITNTLLRKAAETGGVHPLSIDKTSSQFAVRIEQCTRVAECGELIVEMFRTYCRLVNKNSVGGLSPIVQKAIFYIDSDLSGDLTLKSVASAINVSAGYLSTTFSAEVGKTLTEYVTEKRMKHAAYLLASTHLQIQSVAQHCGILDMQYFSKIFKRYMGQTPRSYRNEHKSK